MDEIRELKDKNSQLDLLSKETNDYEQPNQENTKDLVGKSVEAMNTEE